MLEASEEHKSVFRHEPLVVFRHAPNLKDSLVRAKLPKLQIESDKGCFRCGKSKCQLCRFMSEGNSFRSNVSGSEFKISNRYTCDSSWVVYLLGCKVCGKQYVGSTFTDSLFLVFPISSYIVLMCLPTTWVRLGKIVSVCLGSHMSAPQRSRFERNNI